MTPPLKPSLAPPASPATSKTPSEGATATSTSGERRYWRSLPGAATAALPTEAEDRRDRLAAALAAEGERIEDRPRDVLSVDVSRRQFLAVAGATTAVGVSGCARKPYERIIPYAARPEDAIPGKPRQYATAALLGGAVEPLLVTSMDGRPTKVDGNPEHPASAGGSSVFAQADVFGYVDPNRAEAPSKDGEWTDWAAATAALDALAAELKGSRGAGLAVLCGPRPSPTFQRLLGELGAALPNAKIYQHDPAGPSGAREGAALLGARNTAPAYQLARADVLLALDADPLGIEGETVRQARDFASLRRSSLEGGKANRLYVVESAFTTTGTVADNRLVLKAAQMGGFLAAVARELGKAGVAGLEAASGLAGADDAAFGKWPAAVAADLKAHPGRSLVAVGHRQPAAVHALGLLVNKALGNLDKTVSLYEGLQTPAFGTLAELARSLQGGQVKTLVVLDSNPAYDAAGDTGFAAAIGKAATSVHLGLHRDETGKAATWHLPMAHWLECWGDWRTVDGTSSIQQPLIAPLFEGALAPEELLSRLLGAPQSSYALVQATWASKASGLAWDKAVHDGVIAGTTAQPYAGALEGAGLGAAWKAGGAEGTEVQFRLDTTVYDGRFANNPWLQELPDPITKLTWDNAAWVSPATAARLGVSNGDHLSVSAGGEAVEIPAWITPGTADDVVILPLGYGREGGRYAKGAGVNVYPARGAAAPHFAAGTVSRAGGSTQLVTTQEHGELPETRPLIRETTSAAFATTPDFVDAGEVMPADKIKSSWAEPVFAGPHQWGMAIDLNTCTGCNACAIACQVENNVGVVGKERVAKGREMHWIRIDRYFTGDAANPEMRVQPMGCFHCETAPCENVCPVGATAHGPEGLNDMAYNRCIGTRYCSNNCPTKVRRFNFFNYSKENDQAVPLFRLARNPNVTVRFRGVMEKCTYCVQRIQEAKIAAKRAGQDKVADGAVVVACQQACPSGAIMFGDISDPQSQVSRWKESPRDYVILRELNIRPRTSYLAIVRNPNPELV